MSIRFVSKCVLSFTIFASLGSASAFAGSTWKCYTNYGCRTPGGAYWGHYGGSGTSTVSRASAQAAADAAAYSNCTPRCGYFQYYGQGECVKAGGYSCQETQDERGFGELEIIEE